MNVRLVSECQVWARRLPGLLVVVPLVAVLWGTYWSIPVPQDPVRVALVDGIDSDRMIREFSFPDVPDGQVPDQTALLPQGTALVLDFAKPMQNCTVSVRIRGMDKGELRGVKGKGKGALLWEVNRIGQIGDRLATRSTELSLAMPLCRFRFQPYWTSEGCAVSDIRVSRLVWISHLWLLPACWLPILLLVLSGRFHATLPKAGIKNRWIGRVDALGSMALIYSVFFQLSRVSVAILAGLLLLLAVVQSSRWAIGRIPLPALVFNVIFIFLFFRFVPILAEKFIVYRTASDYHLNVDHRMKPDGKEINEDGIRFKGRSADMRVEDFNVLILGDSFAYGMKLPYEDTVPRVLERLAAERNCRSAVRAVNFGWVSSSPMLSCRLLMDIGARYQPDVVVYFLDPTDYHDDIKYAAKISDKEGVKFNSGLLFDNLLDRMLLNCMSIRTLWKFKYAFRPLAAAHRENKRLLNAFASDRYFVTNIPYEEAVPQIRRGVIKNLALIQAYCRDRLNVPMALVLVPRAYQYSDRECPLDYEAHLYTIRGPHVRNPSRFFEEEKSELPYPVLDLLPVFERSEQFPLYFKDDPHWNAAGARLAAESLLDFLIENRLLPCE